MTPEEAPIGLSLSEHDVIDVLMPMAEKHGADKQSLIYGLCAEIRVRDAALAAATARAEREGARAKMLAEALAPFIAGWDEFSEDVFANSPRHTLVRGPYAGITVQMMMDGRAALSPDADARAGTRDAVIAAARAVLAEASSPHSRTPYTAAMVAMENAVAALDAAPTPPGGEPGRGGLPPHMHWQRPTE